MDGEVWRVAFGKGMEEGVRISLEKIQTRNTTVAK
jgi:hypothetical protein